MSFKRLRNTKPASWVVLSILLGFSTTGPVQAQRVKPKLAVGTLAPLSGPMALYGKDMVNGMNLALDVIKSKNEDLGSRINIIAKDNQAKSEATKELTQSLVDSRQADVFFGSISSITTETLISEADRLGKSLIAPAAADHNLSKKKGVFRTCLNNRTIGAMLSQFVVKSLKQKSAIVLYDNQSEYSAAIGKAFVTDFTRRGGKVIETLSYRSGDGSFRTQLEVIKKKRPGVVLVPGYYEEVGRIMKQAMQIGLRIPMVGADGWDSPNLIRIAGKRAIRGHYFLSHFSSEDPDQKVQAFVNAYRRRYNRLPTLTSAMGYDGMLMLADAFDRASTNLPAPLLRSLSGTKKIDGLLGPVYLSENGTTFKPAIINATTGSGWRFHSRVTPDFAASN